MRRKKKWQRSRAKHQRKWVYHLHRLSRDPMGIRFPDMFFVEPSLTEGQLQLIERLRTPVTLPETGCT